VVAQVAAAQVLHGHVEILPVLEGRLHVDDEWIADLLQDAFFVDDRPHALLEQHSE
jgi:hypothetical protein